MTVALAGSISGYHPSGWVQRDIFTNLFFNHFIKFVKPSAFDPIILIRSTSYKEVLSKSQNKNKKTLRECERPKENKKLNKAEVKVEQVTSGVRISCSG